MGAKIQSWLKETWPMHIIGAVLVAAVWGRGFDSIVYMATLWFVLACPPLYRFLLK